MDNTSVLMHEIVHLISSRAPELKKKELSQFFLDNFEQVEKISHNKRIYLIEEPLAVILEQILFTREMLPEYYENTYSWYAHPWVNAMAVLKEKMTDSYLKENKKIDAVFVKSFAIQSSKLMNIKESIMYPEN